VVVLPDVGADAVDREGTADKDGMQNCTYVVDADDDAGIVAEDMGVDEYDCEDWDYCNIAEVSELELEWEQV